MLLEHEKPREVLVWTTEKPTVEGLYVYRHPTEELARVLRLKMDSVGLYLGETRRRTRPNDWPDGRWLGPLPEVPGA